MCTTTLIMKLNKDIVLDTELTIFNYLFMILIELKLITKKPINFKLHFYRHLLLEKQTS